MEYQLKVFALCFGISICVVAAIISAFLIRGYIYKDFVLKHSRAISILDEINEKYEFKDISPMEFSHSYDNKDFYSSISQKDYLIYQLAYHKKEAMENIKAASSNRFIYEKYQNEILRRCVPGDFGEAELLRSVSKLKKTEIKQLKRIRQYPQTEFFIDVFLTLTKINGSVVTSAGERFDEEEIKEVIERLGHKSGDFYLDPEIWDAICRVERGRVSNKMRFAIYRRDGYRCRKCGRRDNGRRILEIDHIYPISKGGKSTYDNLQTLCYQCNMEKSNTVESYAVYKGAKGEENNGHCPRCGAPLRKRKGKYGDFLGCPNYPECRYTKQL